MRRAPVATVLVVLASVALLLTMVVGYARHALLNSGQFADRATVALQESPVRARLAQRVTDGLVLRADADLLAARPLIESAVNGIIQSGAFTTLFRKGVDDVHRAVFDRDSNTVTLTLTDVGTLAGTALEKLRPGIAAQIEKQANVQVLSQRVGSVTGDLGRAATDVRVLAVLLAILTSVFVAAAIVVAPDRRLVIFRLGVGAAIAGVVLVIAYVIARAIVLGQVEGTANRDVASAVWSAFLGDLRTIGWIVAACGALVAATAASVIRPVSIDQPLERAWRVVAAEPQSKALRAVRGVALVAVGLVLVLEPLTTLQVVAVLAGLYIVFQGLQVLLRLVYQPHPEEMVHTAPRRVRVRRLVLLGAIGLIVAALPTAFVATGAATETTPSAGGCNGHASLCDRRLDEVTFPATHNAMSAPLPGWFSSEQDNSIGAQLNAGIRGLLLDTHYGDALGDGKVRTFFANRADLQEKLSVDGVSHSTFDAAMRLRARLGFKGKGKRGMFLCHTFCELGATPLSTGLGDVHQFLVTHPTDVVVIVNQDYVTPADFVKAVTDAGLARYAYAGPLTGRLPTLGEMVRSDKRLVLLAENHAGAAPWYRSAYSAALQDTPYTFKRASLLTKQADLPASCRDGRGPSSAPLFLVNHWVSTDPIPKPSDAVKVNAYAPLLARARECERLRHRRVNLLAVNFYKRGDLFRVVDTLNGVGGSR
jgi:hypothetical protein